MSEKMEAPLEVEPSDLPSVSMEKGETRESSEWEEVFKKLTDSPESLKKQRVRPLGTLVIGVCLIGVGAIGAWALIRGADLETARRFAEVYSVLFIITGLLLAIFSALEYKSK